MLDVAEHAGRPAGAPGGLADGDVVHAAELTTSVSRLACSDQAGHIANPEDAVTREGRLDRGPRLVERLAAVGGAGADVREHRFDVGDVESVLEALDADVGEDRGELLRPGLEPEV